MSKALRLMDAVSMDAVSMDAVSMDAVSMDAVSADRSALVGLADMLGCWHSCDEKNAGIPFIEVSLQGDQATAQILGAAGDGLVDWGVVSTRALLSDGPASPRVAGFVVGLPLDSPLPLGDAQAHLQINFKIGVAVAGVFVRGTDASGQPRALFWREFLARGQDAMEPVRPLSDTYPESLSHRLLHAIAADFSTASIEGRWRNTNSRSRGIPEVAVESRGGNVVLRMWGRAEDGGLVDWGEVSAETYGAIEEDNQFSSCALATYEFDFMDCEVQLRQNKGIMALTTFNRFKDSSDRFDYVTRELYYREAQ